MNPVSILNTYKGKGSSCISMEIPSRMTTDRVRSFLNQEAATASNIKSRV